MLFCCTSWFALLWGVRVTTYSSAKESIWYYSKIKLGISSVLYITTQNMTRSVRVVVAATNQTVVTRITNLEETNHFLYRSKIPSTAPGLQEIINKMWMTFFWLSLLWLTLSAYIQKHNGKFPAIPKHFSNDKLQKDILRLHLLLSKVNHWVMRLSIETDKPCFGKKNPFNNTGTLYNTWWIIPIHTSSCYSIWFCIFSLKH